MVIGVYDGRPVYLKDVAEVSDGPEEPANYVWLGSGRRLRRRASRRRPRPAGGDARRGQEAGTNAVVMVEDLDAMLDGLQGPVIPSDVNMLKTRDYGFTAKEKSNELLKHLYSATIAVILLMWITLSRREATVVAVVIPVTLALTLAASYFFGYTLNRVSLFALVFSIGILVDDAIVVVENIHRHFKLKWAEPRADHHLRGGRGRQPHDPRHLRHHLGAAAAGLRPRPDGPVHAADPDQRLGGHAVLADGGVHHLTVAGLQALPQGVRNDEEIAESGRRTGPRRSPTRDSLCSRLLLGHAADDPHPLLRGRLPGRRRRLCWCLPWAPWPSASRR